MALRNEPDRNSPAAAGSSGPVRADVLALARHHALADVAARADDLADAAAAAIARCPPGEDRDHLRHRWDQLCRIAHSLRTAPGYRLPPDTGAAP